jgi:phosphoglycolate phosphatase
MRPTLLLFDIDGTLLLTGGAGKRAMVRALSEAFGATGAFEGLDMAGRTDTELLSAAFARLGLPDTLDAHARFREAYVPRLEEEVQQPGTGRKAVMPGVRALLDTLTRQPDAHLALLTGNYRDAARVKLSYFALVDFFAWGAFGDESHDRNELARIAIYRAEIMGVPPDARANALVIGDTPQDIACARAIGARAMAVATGIHTAEELRAAGADVVLDDLGDTEAIVRLL